MNWLVVIWAVNAAICFTLAVLHFLVWCHRRTSWANFFFALTAFAAVLYGLGELWMIQARTPEEFGRALWYLHIPGTFIVIGTQKSAPAEAGTLS